MKTFILSVRFIFRQHSRTGMTFLYADPDVRISLGSLKNALGFFSLIIAENKFGGRRSSMIFTCYVQQDDHRR